MQQGRSSEKRPCAILKIWRGTNQIRTGVDGFADRYLTTRTWYLVFCDAKLLTISDITKFS